MAVTKLEQWKSERRSKTRPFIVGERTHVVEIECDHCSRHFFRWTSTAAAYWRC